MSVEARANLGILSTTRGLIQSDAMRLENNEVSFISNSSRYDTSNHLVYVRGSSSVSWRLTQSDVTRLLEDNEVFLDQRS